MKYPREYLGFVERVIREYPQKLEELKRLEDTIVACCHMNAIPSTPSSARTDTGADTEPERVVIAKEQNRHYQRLSRYVATVQLALKRLTRQELAIIDLSCWQEMKSWEVSTMLHVEERNFWRIRSRALQKMVQAFAVSSIAPPE
jgi:DNA-directed RNA polymerase specialized sigma subunit